MGSRSRRKIKIVRLFSCLPVLAWMLSFTGCKGMMQAPESVPEGSGEEFSILSAEERGSALPDPAEKAEETEASAPAASESADVLVVYFSRTGEQYNVGVIEKGNTAIVAEMIGDRLGADLWEILPAEDRYPMTYGELTDVAKQEQNENARPAYAGEAPDFSRYDTIFIGAPVWWGDWPMILYTFFENNADALSGKTLIPFSTHEGSGLSGFDKKLSAACPDSAVGEGLAIRGSDAQNKRDEVKENVNRWLEKLGYS